MKKPAYVITNNSILINIDNTPQTVLKESPKYPDLLAAINEERWDDCKAIVENSIEAKSYGKMKRDGDKIFVELDNGKMWEVPADLGIVISRFIEKDLPFEPLIKFAINLSKNPSQRSIEQLFSFLKVNDMPITEDGCFIAYKAIRADFKDIHSGTFDNSVGTVVSMPREKVNDDPNVTCSTGLHVANYHYACNVFARHTSQDKLVYCSVNPEDVVSIPVDYNNAKMRVCKYKVVGVTDYEFKDPLYSSNKGFYGSESINYAPPSDSYEKYEY